MLVHIKIKLPKLESSCILYDQHVVFNVFDISVHVESPLVYGGRQNVVTRPEDSPGKCSEAYSKGSLSFQHSKDSNEEARGSISQDDSSFVQEELARRRELALRQHAFFQLRLHIKRGANLVAMDRCGEINFHFSLLLPL